jgi:hypothetical protein
MTSGRVMLQALWVVGAAVASGPLAAADFLGLYFGGAVGHSTVRADQVGFVDATGTALAGPVSLSAHHPGWKLVAGLRPLSLIGAEIEYIDFGKPTATSTPSGFGLGYTADVRAKATAAFGVLYAPIPLPLVDVYGKAGLARLQTTVDGTAGFGCFPPLTCPLASGGFHRDQSTTRPAYGAGAQVKVGRLAIRAEYERINANNGDPDLLSIGATWSF